MNTSIGADRPRTIAVAIVGAGPYGLALAAHLRPRGVPFRLFGRPMQMWRDRMPRDMHLKSEPFASNLYEPTGKFTLRRYCIERGIPYAHGGLPISRETFCSYAHVFQKRFVPDVDKRDVVRLRRCSRGAGEGFVLELEDGEVVHAAKVVLAVGISHFAHLPNSFEAVSGEFRSHSSAAADPERFSGQRVAVIGGGSSAIDCAVMLAGTGVETHLLTRRDVLGFHRPPAQRRTLKDRIKKPQSTVGPGWRGVMCTRLPDIFHAMPPSFRVRVTRNFLGPAPCWFTRTPFERTVQLHASVRDLTMSDATGGGVSLCFSSNGFKTLEVDHVIAATGFRAELDRLKLIDPALLELITREGDMPALNRSFMSSVPGLFFVGVSASNAFGPMLRFACGAKFAARRLSYYLARTTPRGKSHRRTQSLSLYKVSR